MPTHSLIRMARDRRASDRLTNPHCPMCETPDPHAVTRTEYVVYVSCAICSYVWSLPKPRVPQLFQEERQYTQQTVSPFSVQE